MEPLAADSAAPMPRLRFARLRRIPRTFYWCLASFVLGSAATAGVVYFLVERKTPPTPLTIAYSIHRGDDYRPLWTVNDLPTVQAFDSLFAAEPGREIPLQNGTLVYTFHRQMSTGRSESKVEVRRDGDGYLWSEDGRAYRLSGEFEAVLRAFPAVRCAQLLQSVRVPEREEGLRMRAAQRDELLDALLMLAAGENPRVAKLGLHNLDALVREIPWQQYGPQWIVRRDHRRSEKAPRAGEVCRAALGAIERIIKSPPAPDDRQWWEINAVCELLGETGDMSTADEIVRLLAVELHRNLTDQLMAALETIHGLPPSYRQIRGCGNITEAERQAREAANTAVRIPARDRLVKWHAEQRSRSREDGFDAILEAWEGTISPTDYRGGLGIDQLSPLDPTRRILQFGPELVPALKRRQRQAADDVERGKWEFVAAIVTSDCDAELVERLPAGDVRSQTVACRVIGASGVKKWPADRLAKFLHVPTHDPKVKRDRRQVEALREAAAFALAACFGPEAVPLLEAAKERSLTASSAISYYRTPSRPVY